MNRFTVEETNLISIYIADTRRELGPVKIYAQNCLQAPAE